MLQSYRELVRMRAGALRRRALAEEICMELTIHARLEELLYPALREALQDEDLFDEAEDRGGCAGCRADPGQLAGGPAVRARVAALAEYVDATCTRSASRSSTAHSLPAWTCSRWRARWPRDGRLVVSDALREDALASAHA